MHALSFSDEEGDFSEGNILFHIKKLHIEEHDLLTAWLRCNEIRQILLFNHIQATNSRGTG